MQVGASRHSPLPAQNLGAQPTSSVSLRQLVAASYATGRDVRVAHLLGQLWAVGYLEPLEEDQLAQGAQARIGQLHARQVQIPQAAQAAEVASRGIGQLGVATCNAHTTCEDTCRLGRWHRYQMSLAGCGGGMGGAFGIAVLCCF